MHMRCLTAHIAVGIILTLTTLHAVAAEDKKASTSKIIKWVDDKGITHYGDSMPVQESGRSNSVINSQGIVVRKNQAGTGNGATDTSITADQLEHQRRDKALLASYTTPEEIDLARDRNLQIDQIALEALQQRHDNVTTQLISLNKNADALKARKKPISPEMQSDIEGKKNELTRINSQMQQRKNSIEATRQRFESDKQRFIELRSGQPPLAP